MRGPWRQEVAIAVVVFAVIAVVVFVVGQSW
jgi:hypothetical protein